jgi:hypothetical protein
MLQLLFYRGSVVHVWLTKSVKFLEKTKYIYLSYAFHKVRFGSHDPVHSIGCSPCNHSPCCRRLGSRIAFKNFGNLTYFKIKEQGVMSKKSYLRLHILPAFIFSQPILNLLNQFRIGINFNSIVNHPVTCSHIHIYYAKYRSVTLHKS